MAVRIYIMRRQRHDETSVCGAHSSYVARHDGERVGVARLQPPLVQQHVQRLQHVRCVRGVVVGVGVPVVAGFDGPQEPVPNICTLMRRLLLRCCLRCGCMYWQGVLFLTCLLSALIRACAVSPCSRCVLHPDACMCSCSFPRCRCCMSSTKADGQ
jgi:hypothetical protein